MGCQLEGGVPTRGRRFQLEGGVLAGKVFQLEDGFQLEEGDSNKRKRGLMESELEGVGYN